jgi:hypothetical protein
METTAQHHEAIRRFLDRLKGRERSLLLVRSAASGGTALAILSLGLAIALSMGAPAGVVGVTAASAGLLFVAGAVWWPLRGRWLHSGAPHRQARLVEGRLPGLRGRLITVLDRGAEPAGASPALLHRAADHAGRAIGLISPSSVHGGRPASVREWSWGPHARRAR